MNLLSDTAVDAASEVKENKSPEQMIADLEGTLITLQKQVQFIQSQLEAQREKPNPMQGKAVSKRIPPTPLQTFDEMKAKAELDVLEVMFGLSPPSEEVPSNWGQKAILHALKTPPKDHPDNGGDYERFTRSVAPTEPPTPVTVITVDSLKNEYVNLTLHEIKMHIEAAQTALEEQKPKDEDPSDNVEF